jgi:chemotaxis signal transduction protein
MLACKVARQRYFIALKSIHEVIPLIHITETRGLAKILRGQCNYRGEILMVVDMGESLLGKKLTESLASRIIVVKRGDLQGYIGLLFDEAYEVTLCKKEQSEQPPAQPLPEYIGSSFLVNGTIVQEILVNELDKALFSHAEIGASL